MATMTLAQKYILRRIFTIFPFALGVPFLIVWLIQILRASGFLSSAVVPFGLLLEASAWGIPSFAAAILPFCAALSVTYAYHYMAANSELVIMRSIGMKPFDLAKPALLFGLFVTAIGYFLSTYLVPHSSYKFRTLKYEIINTENLSALTPGRFLVMPRSVVLFAAGEKADGDKEVFTGLFIHQADKGESVVVAANEGRVFKTDDGFKITAVDGWRQQMESKSRQSNTLRFGKYDFDFAYENKPRRVTGTQRKIKEVPLPLLFKVKARGNERMSEAAKRLLSPLYNLGLIFLAAALGVTTLFSRGHGYADLLLIAVIALVVQLFNFATISFLETHSWGLALIAAGFAAMVAAPLIIIRNKGERAQKGK